MTAQPLAPTSPFSRGRHAGLLIPLFSMPSTGSWGIGEITDLPWLTSWLRSAGFDFVQILPVTEMAPGQRSPYSSLSALAIDPIFIAVGEVDDFVLSGGVEAFGADFARDLDRARRSPVVDYDAVRALKTRALSVAFDRFYDEEWTKGTGRAAELGAFVERERWWLDDYVLFRALYERFNGASWVDWEARYRDRRAQALSDARAELAQRVLFYQYLQWLADSQWQSVRRQLRGVGLFGDFPFMVSRDSADVWARQQDFLFDAHVGTPPDEFSETGQNWYLPVYDWGTVAGNGYTWLRQRARRYADLFDGYRVDHLVGFYRTYAHPIDGAPPYFTPAEEPEQTALGECVLTLLAGAGPEIIAEDLGTVPDFVRASLARLGVPGFKVMRWERYWEEPGQPFRHPAHYPAVSVATTGTHDMDTLAAWWETTEADLRRQLAEVPSLRTLDHASGVCTPAIRDTVLGAMFGAGSDLLILPIQDIFGWHDRINVPATVNDDNWTWRLPWPVDHLTSIPEAGSRADTMRLLSHRGRRC